MPLSRQPKANIIYSSEWNLVSKIWGTCQTEFDVSSDPLNTNTQALVPVYLYCVRLETGLEPRGGGESISPHCGGWFAETRMVFARGREATGLYPVY